MTAPTKPAKAEETTKPKMANPIGGQTFVAPEDDVIKQVELSDSVGLRFLTEGRIEIHVLGRSIMLYEDELAVLKSALIDADAASRAERDKRLADIRKVYLRWITFEYPDDDSFNFEREMKKLLNLTEAELSNTQTEPEESKP